jgi:DNA-binding transcriptional MerR regulator
MSKDEPQYRVEELAEVAGASVDTIRYYQHLGLLDAPSREGRVAFYGPVHLARLQRIRQLKDQGLSLATIHRVLSGALHPADAALVSAVAASSGGALSRDGARPSGGLDLTGLAEATGVPEALLESLVAEGLLSPANPDTPAPYGAEDVDAVHAGLRLLEAGLPLSKLLDLGRRYTEAVEVVADEAVALFDEFVRGPARAGDDPEAARTQLVDAFEELLPAATSLVRLTFERALLRAARRRIDEHVREE